VLKRDIKSVNAKMVYRQMPDRMNVSVGIHKKDTCTEMVDIDVNLQLLGSPAEESWASAVGDKTQTEGCLMGQDAADR
jgi:hypothetical protein